MFVGIVLVLFLLPFEGYSWDVNSRILPRGDGDFHPCPKSEIIHFSDMETSLNITSLAGFDIGACVPSESGDNNMNWISVGLWAVGEFADIATPEIPFPIFSMMAGILDNMLSSMNNQDDYMKQWSACMEAMMHDIVDQTLHSQAAVFLQDISDQLELLEDSLRNEEFDEASNYLTLIHEAGTFIFSTFAATSKPEQAVPFVIDAAITEFMARATYMAALAEKNPEAACSQGGTQLLNLKLTYERIFQGDSSLQHTLDRSKFHNDWPNSFWYGSGYCDHWWGCGGVDWFTKRDNYLHQDDCYCWRECGNSCREECNNLDPRKECKRFIDYVVNIYKDLSSDIKAANVHYTEMKKYIEHAQTVGCTTTTAAPTTTTTKPTTTTMLTTTTKPTTTTEEVPTQCRDYNTLSTQDRRPTWAGPDYWYCDYEDHKNESPDWKGPGWYRFTGEAGTKMPTAAPGDWSCGTGAPGWLNGQHPSEADGEVDREVCFQYTEENKESKKTCNWRTNISVFNCGDFMVYKLPNTPKCTLRYCGDGK